MVDTNQDAMKNKLDNKNNFEEGANRVFTSIRDSGDKVAKSMGDVFSDTKKQGEEVIEYIKENPIKSIAFSVLAGMIMSKIFRNS